MLQKLYFSSENYVSAYTPRVKVGIVNKIAYTKLQYMKLHLKHLFMCVCV